jgi:transcriptional/translational regulatory protein YebC/TACO1
MDKETQQLLRNLRLQGWRVEKQRRAGHYRLYPPNGGPFIVTGGTPSDSRGTKNLRAQLRRAGAQL